MIRRTIRFVALSAFLQTCIAMNLSVITAMPIACADSDEWSSWRGGNLQAVSQETVLPEGWASHENLNWKTEIQGEGHSSPVVSNGSIYLTTSQLSSSSQVGVQLLDALVLCLLVLCLISAITFRTITKQSDESGNRWNNFSVLADCMLVSAMTTLTLFGDRMLDYERCPIRGWLASIVLVTICSVQAARISHQGRRTVAFIVLCLFGIAFVAIANVPSPRHAFRGGLLSANSLMVFLTAGFPVASGILLLQTIGPARQPGSHLFKICYRVFLTSALLVLAIAPVCFILFYDIGEHSNRGPDFAISYEHVPIIGLGATMMILGSVLRKKHAGSASVLFMVGGGLAFAGSGVFAVQWLAGINSYLGYHFGKLRWESKWSPPVLCVLPVVVLIAVSLIAIVFSGRQTQRFTFLFLRLSSILFLALGIVQFYSINCVTHGAQTNWDYSVISVDQSSGKINWRSVVFQSPKVHVDRRNSLATPTPAVLGNYIVVYFGSVGTACVDRQGDVKWSNRSDGYDTVYGVASSPLIADGHAIVQADMGNESSQVSAYELETGRTRWRSQLPRSKLPSYTGNSRTPLVIRVPSRRHLVVWGHGFVKAIDIATGRELWNIDDDRLIEPSDLVASPVYSQNRLFLTVRNRTISLLLDDTVGQAPTLDWINSRVGANCATPVVVGNVLFLVSDNGIMSCLDAASGAILKRQRIGSEFFSSPVAVQGTVLFSDTDGKVVSVRDHEPFNIIESNQLPGALFATPAISGQSIYFRSGASLLSFGRSKVP